MKIYERLHLRAELLLSLLIRFLVLAGFVFLAWVVLDFQSYSNILPVALLQVLFWWYLVSLGILPLLLCFRLWVENGKGAGIDAFLVTMWVFALLAFWIIR